jgi:DNA-directed RNA polymerase specialized sigma24 family protein
LSGKVFKVTPIETNLAAGHFSGETAAPHSSLVEEGRREDESPRTPGDADIVARVLAGDAEAYRSLVERYQRAVLGLAARLLGPGGDAEDLAQEAFVRAYRYLPTLKEPDRFGPWLYQVVRSLSRDRNRRKDAERKALERRRDALRWAMVPCGDGIASELYRLPPAEYQVLRMRYFEGMSYEEIGRRRSMTFSQVDHLIRKARERLARHLSRERERERSL